MKKNVYYYDETKKPNTDPEKEEAVKISTESYAILEVLEKILRELSFR